MMDHVRNYFYQDGTMKLLDIPRSPKQKRASDVVQIQNQFHHAVRSL